MKMRGEAMAKDMLKATNRMEHVANGFALVESGVGDVSEEVLENTMDDLGWVHKDFLKLQYLVPEALKQLDEIGLRTMTEFASGEMPFVPEPTEEELLQQQAEAGEMLSPTNEASEAPSSPDSQRMSSKVPIRT